MLSANERPENRSHDLFWTNHKAWFHHFKSSKGSPLLKFSMEVCHLVLSTLTYPKYIEGFVKYGDEFCHIWVRICHIWGPSPYLTNPSIHSGYVKVWYLSPRFVIYWNCPNIDKSHPLMTNHYTPSGQRKLQAMLSANERPGNRSCDVFWTNHKSWFHHLKSGKGSPLLII